MLIYKPFTETIKIHGMVYQAGKHGIIAIPDHLAPIAFNMGFTDAAGRLKEVEKLKALEPEITPTAEPPPEPPVYEATEPPPELTSELLAEINQPEPYSEFEPI